MRRLPNNFAARRYGGVRKRLALSIITALIRSLAPFNPHLSLLDFSLRVLLREMQS